MADVSYIHLRPGQAPPAIDRHPFIGLIVAEEPVSDEWRALVSAWLVHGGCLYTVAWGQDCSAWHDSVDHANLEDFDWQEIPDDAFVMTSWHENEPLSEALWFATRCAVHPTVAIDHTIIVHVAAHPREDALRSALDAARDE